MENIINLEQLDYRDQLIKDYIDNQEESIKEYTDEQDNVVREYADEQDNIVREYADEQDKEVKKYVDEKTSHIKSSGDVYYDYATWQKPYVKWGANVVFASTPWGKNDSTVLLEIGKTDQHETIEEDQATVIYNGVINSDSVKSILPYIEDTSYVSVHVEDPVLDGNSSGFINVDYCDASIDEVTYERSYKLFPTYVISFDNSFAQMIRNGEDINLTLSMEMNPNSIEHAPKYLRMYIPINMRYFAEVEGKHSDSYTENVFINIHADREKKIWNFKAIPQKTVKVKYHKTQFDLDTDTYSISRSKYTKMEDYTERNINPEEFLREITGEYDSESEYGYSEEYSLDSLGCMVRRCVQNLERTKGDRSCQFRWTYKPTAAEGGYSNKIARAMGIYYTDTSDIFSYGEYIKRKMSWFARTNNCKPEKWGDDGNDNIHGAYLDFLVGGLVKCKKTKYKFDKSETKDSVSYNKLRFTKRPLHIRIIAIANLTKNEIKYKTKYFGNIDPLKISY